jgi:hypothetical protein
VGPLSSILAYVYDGRSLGVTGTVLVAVTVILRIGYMLWRRRRR